ncbi:MAG: IS66 family transposase [Polyangiaceae bacterium]
MFSIGVSESERIAELELLVSEARAELANTAEQLAATTKALEATRQERDRLRAAYHRLFEQVELLRHRIYAAKAERVNPLQLELEFKEAKDKLDRMAANLEKMDRDSEQKAAEGPQPTADSDVGSRPSGKPPVKPRQKSEGRRDFDELDIPEKRIEILDPALDGNAELIGWEESSQVGFQRPGPIRVITARAKYKTEATESAPVRIVTAPLPKMLLSRCVVAPSLLAHIVTSKFRFGMPYFRQEKALAADGIELARSTMARCVEDLGASLGAVVLAMADDARRTAFCLSTDATGISIRPEPLADGSRQACRKGHFFVVLADKKHVFFEYQPKHRSAAVCEMFRGFSGYIQADANAVYDALFRGEAVDDPTNAPIEVGCWSHCRRRFWEAAIVGYPLGREGLLRIRKLFELEQSWSDLPPSNRHKKREAILKPLIDEFFDWVRIEYERVKDERGLVPTALGYASRQEQGLRNFLRDGRLRMDNNLSEGALKPVCTGRRAWLFFGSDDHAQAAANLFSLIASCQLHGIEPEQYLAELIHVMPYWPRNRYLELAPANWRLTRERLVAEELSREIGPITVPPPLTSSAEQLPSN